MTAEAPLRILLLDDDEDEFVIVTALARRTRRAYVVDWTSDAAAALKDMRRGGHDAYLVDYRLGATTGVDVIRSAVDQGVTAPIILLTGTSADDAEVDVEALQSGAADYLCKQGLTPESLDRSLRYARERARSAQLREHLRHSQEETQAREEFLSIASHELRTPLTALLLQLQNIERSVRPDDSAPRLKQRLHGALKASQRLSALVETMLEVSRITGGRLQLEPQRCKLDAIVREVLSGFGEQAAGASSPIVDRIEPDVAGTWDRSRLEQVVGNLLSNAIKYGAGKPVEIEVRREGDDAVLRVVDHGIGIDPDKQQRIFERFERAVTSRQYGGFGLGLWITRQVVEASGGRISVTSKPGEGAAFTVTLPTRTQT